MELVALEAQSERAVVVPELGCQILGYRVGALEILSAPNDPEEFRKHPHRGGIPILFPWPGRVASGRFNFEGCEYRVPVNEPARGHSLHGFACERPFRVTSRGPYFLSAELDYAGDESATSRWRWPFKLTIDYEVGLGLRMTATIANTGTSAMPFGFGAHPYFRAPLGELGHREDVVLQLDADSRWPLDSAMIPSGAPISLEGKFDLRAGARLGDLEFDDAFRMAPVRDADVPRARIIDRSARAAVEIVADAAFPDFVIYAPRAERYVAVEPYTCAPDAFNLASRGIDSGMRVLGAGETFSARFEIRVASA